MSRDKNSHLRLAGRPADYQKLGIDPVEVAQFEDGQRISTEKGRYEWWYFDAHLDDGATVVVVFYTKPNVSPNGPLAPRITINLTLPDGRRFEKFYDTTADQFTASKEGCDVRIGTNRFVGDLRRYRITAAIEDISVEIDLTGEVRAWRPKSGHIYFDAEGREALFAWLPSVPQGVAHVRYKIGHEEYRAAGSGYHDHNWGDVPMQTLMHNWYWARAKAGPYTVIASHITATEAYGYETQIVYLLAKDDEIVADDEGRVSFETERVATDGKTGKPVADITRYKYRDGDARYVVTFERQKTILQAIFTERAPFIKRLIAKIVGFDGVGSHGGSIFGAVLWMAASMLFSWYVATFDSYNKTYGSLGAGVGFMVWLWISAVIVLLGGELNAEMEHQTARDTTEGRSKPLGSRGAMMADRVGKSQD